MTHRGPFQPLLFCGILWYYSWKVDCTGSSRFFWTFPSLIWKVCLSSCLLLTLLMNTPKLFHRVNWILWVSTDSQQSSSPREITTSTNISLTYTKVFGHYACFHIISHVLCFTGHTGSKYRYFLKHSWMPLCLPQSPIFAQQYANRVWKKQSWNLPLNL